MAGPRIIKDVRCRSCGSTDVLADAYARWDIQKQEYKLESTFDKGSYCNVCDGEARLDEVEISVFDPAVTIIGSDDFAVCPACGVRLDPDIDPETDDNRVIDEDSDGPIYLGTCADHGASLYQIQK